MECFWPDVKDLVWRIQKWDIDNAKFNDGPYEWVQAEVTKNKGLWAIARSVADGKIQLPSGITVPGDFDYIRFSS